jgi:hypothetical protein
MANNIPYTKEEIVEAVKKSKSYSDVYRQLGLQINGGSYKWMKKLIEDNNLDISHFMTSEERMRRMTELSNKSKGESLYSTDNLSNGERLSSGKLQGFLKFKGIAYLCNSCGLDRWLDKPIRLDIDHIDGDCANNHIKNLQYICPNCHRQKTIELVETKNGLKTKAKICKEKPSKTNKCVDCENLINIKATRCLSCSGSKRIKINYPSKDILLRLLWEKPTSLIAKDIGCSDKAIEKYAKKLGLSKPDRGYWQKLKYINGSREDN